MNNCDAWGNAAAFLPAANSLCFHGTMNNCDIAWRNAAAFLPTANCTYFIGKSTIYDTWGNAAAFLSTAHSLYFQQNFRKLFLEHMQTCCFDWHRMGCWGSLCFGVISLLNKIERHSVNGSIGNETENLMQKARWCGSCGLLSTGEMACLRGGSNKLRLRARDLRVWVPWFRIWRCTHQEQAEQSQEKCSLTFFTLDLWLELSSQWFCPALWARSQACDSNLVTFSC